MDSVLTNERKTTPISYSKVITFDITQEDEGKGLSHCLGAAILVGLAMWATFAYIIIEVIQL